MRKTETLQELPNATQKHEVSKCCWCCWENGAVDLLDAGLYKPSIYKKYNTCEVPVRFI